MNRTARQMERLCKDVIVLDSEEEENVPSLSDMARRAHEILKSLQPRRRTERERATVKAKAQTKESAALRSAANRAEVMARADGCCEFCDGPGPLEWHHIIGGPLRKKMESVETTAAICVPCHRGWDKSDDEVLESATCWAMAYNFGAAFTAIQKRWTHARAARAARAGDER